MPQGPRRPKGSTSSYSWSRILRREGRLTDQFETMLNALSLEEVIGLKLELASQAIGGKLYGLPIWNSFYDICREAILKYAVSAARTKVEAGRFLGVNEKRFRELLKAYKIDEFFRKENP